jgi:hypothetical protein
MSKQFIFKIIVALSPLLSWGQYSEIGVYGGGSNFLGDVGPYGLDLPQGYSAGIFYRYNFDYHWSVRAQANYGFIKATDSRSNIDFRKDRNLSFQSEIWEVGAVAEFNFFEYRPGTKNWHTPFINAGFGFFWFDPMASFQGELVSLQSLRTEGQGTSVNSDVPYYTTSTFFSFGLGYKFAVGRITTIGVESSFRSTYTDYLDDVSGFYADPEILKEEVSELAAIMADRSLTGGDKENLRRGNPANRDWYIFTGVTLQVKFVEFYEKCASFVGN